MLKYLSRTRDYVFVFQSVEIIQKGDVTVDKIPLVDNLIDILTKTLIEEGRGKEEEERKRERLFDGHKDNIGFK